nr:hypothetical protein [Actinoplanes awajinensis]
MAAFGELPPCRDLDDRAAGGCEERAARLIEASAADVRRDGLAG